MAAKVHKTRTERFSSGIFSLLFFALIFIGVPSLALAAAYGASGYGAGLYGTGGDVTSPIISTVSAGSPGVTSTLITWITDEVSDSQVQYGATNAYGASTTLDTGMTTSHSVAVTGLSANTLYHYQVRSTDASGNLATSSDYTFTTAAAATVSSGGGGGGSSGGGGGGGAVGSISSLIGTLTSSAATSTTANNIAANGGAAATTTAVQTTAAIPTCLAETTTSTTAVDTTSYAFTRELTVGAKGADVLALQEYLNTHGFVIAASGPGSPGNESTYFGKATQAALAKWQKAQGITPAAGYFGAKTRAAVNAGGVVTQTSTINAQCVTQTTATTVSTGDAVFTRDLTLGSRGSDVSALQEYLNTHGFVIAASGPGSPGNESTYFGKATQAALAKWQKAQGITPAAGYFGAKTRGMLK